MLNPTLLRHTRPQRYSAVSKKNKNTDTTQEPHRRPPRVEIAALALVHCTSSKCSVVDTWCSDEGPFVTRLTPNTTAESGQLVHALEFPRLRKIEQNYNRANNGLFPEIRIWLCYFWSAGCILCSRILCSDDGLIKIRQKAYNMCLQIPVFLGRVFDGCRWTPSPQQKGRLLLPGVFFDTWKQLLTSGLSTTFRLLPNVGVKCESMVDFLSSIVKVKKTNMHISPNKSVKKGK